MFKYVYAAYRELVLKVNPEIIPRIVGKDDSPKGVNLGEMPLTCHAVHDLVSLFAVNLDVPVIKVLPFCPTVRALLVLNPFSDKDLIHDPIVLSLHVLNWSGKIFKADTLRKSMKGRIRAVYPEGRSSVYSYVCRGDEGVFSFPVEWRYHIDIVESEGYPVGREIDYDDDIEPPVVRFLD